MIPRIIHQTWKTSEVPDEWQLAVESWRHHHPEWEYRMWTNRDGYNFVQREYPDFYPAYCAFPYDIQRADAIRYLVVHRYGGLYADMDYECLQPFDDLIAEKHFVIGYEPPDHYSEWEDPDVLCNALFAAVPGSTFLQRAIDYMQLLTTPAITITDVLESTGPLMLQHLLKMHGSDGLDIFPSHLFCPLAAHSSALGKLRSNHVDSDGVRRLLVEQGVYAVHYWSNSWADNLVGGPLHNPEPDSVPGFRFYPGRDAPGNDLFNGGRDIPELAVRCRADPCIVAFNTHGFAKSGVGHEDAWVVIDNPDGNAGLYLKLRPA